MSSRKQPYLWTMSHACICTYTSQPTIHWMISPGRLFSRQDVTWLRIWRDSRVKYRLEPLQKSTQHLLLTAWKFPHRPIIFIAHSLGGALLKKAYTIAFPKRWPWCEIDYRQALLLAHHNLQDSRFKLVVDCLSGILFLGTPHAGVSDEDTLLRHNQVLFSCAKIAVQKQSSRPSSHDVFQLANLSATFEQIANIPVLSVFEYADRRSSVQKFFGKRSRVSQHINSRVMVSRLEGTCRWATRYDSVQCRTSTWGASHA